ncbi:MAG TPA: hypothetical protein VH186_08920 [Chloroflexia bacterium]|nr:hypothetical protein [Chloroflexia bacterium]
MNEIDAQAIAGFLSTTIFVVSSLPMLLKAYKTRNLKSYSLTQISLSNLGNLIYWLYVSNLPFGAVWLLHSFNSLTTFLMLIWHLKYSDQV